MNDEYLDEEQVRLRKINELKKAGVKPYPSRIKKTKPIRNVLDNFDKLSKDETLVSLAGRLKTTRIHGGSTFADLADESGQIQLFFSKDALGDKKYKILTDMIDPADFISVRGTLFTTKRGEKTLHAESFELLSKALLPLPAKWHGLVDTEIRYRKRYLDLLSNPEVKLIFQKRSLIIKYLRNFLDKEGFVEVETPIFQPIAGGAAAKPFTTHHNALDVDLYLRIAPELYLKRLIVGGYEKVFEIGRNFRNEGIDHSHNPEFTMLEFYWAYKNYNDLMKFTEKLFLSLLTKLEKNTKIKFGEIELDFTPPYPRIKFADALQKNTGINIDDYRGDLDKLRAKARELGVEYEKHDSWQKVMDEIYKKCVRAKCIQPVFIIDYPVEMAPLAKKCEYNPNYVQKFQLIANGMELLNAYTEVNDPVDQQERFEEQQKNKEAGDEEAQTIDYDFIEALKHGMPPTAGWGMGIDRLCTLLCNAYSVKEVILFPTLKPKK